MRNSSKKRNLFLYLIIFTVSSCLLIGVWRRVQFDLAGYWKLDQPTHAMYEASIYEFRSNGTLRLFENYAIGNDPEYAVGQVWNVPPGASSPPTKICEFGSKWHKLFFQVISISSNCSDSKNRNVILWILPRVDGNHAYAVVLFVDGSVGWSHGPFPWQWTKCIDLDDCMPWE